MTDSSPQELHLQPQLDTWSLDNRSAASSAIAMHRPTRALRARRCALSGRQAYRAAAQAQHPYCTHCSDLYGLAICHSVL
jgi:hypothetical protein